MVMPAVMAFAWVLLSVGPAVAAPPATLFGSIEFRAESHAALPQWRRTLGGIESELPRYAACAEKPSQCTSRAAMVWEAHLASLSGLPREDQLRRLNRFINQWPRKTVAASGSSPDHWATPLEFMGHPGNAEDFAIAKYVSLRRLGWPPEKLRMAIVRDRLRDHGHAVLAVWLDDDDVIILDSLTDAAMPQDRISHYEPQYSVNEIARWTHASAAAALVSTREPRSIEGR